MLRYGRVLIVEGPIMRKVIRQMLAGSGFANFDEVPGGTEALSVLARITYALVIADWNMAPVSGMDLLVQMRALPRNRDTPFVMTTGKGQKRFAAVGRDNGATRYLEKPFTAEVLLERVGEASARLSPAPEASSFEPRSIRRR